ncbi:MAG: rRNA maturation RNase YbeY [Rhodospirillales bacterium]|nr:rRNA maturation RNase YbeY [Rhodospirillales bacterium]
MIKTQLNVDIADDRWLKELPEVEKFSADIFDKVISEISPKWLDGKNSVIINLSLNNDEEIRQLNSEFRQMDKSTNVLSFANLDDEEFEAYLARNTEIELGDIIIALETMLNQSKDQDMSLHDHYCHILIHGILHLLGYDHMEAEEAKEMEGEEIKLLKLFDIENPYEERE